MFDWSTRARLKTQAMQEGSERRGMTKAEQQGRLHDAILPPVLHRPSSHERTDVTLARRGAVSEDAPGAALAVPSGSLGNRPSGVDVHTEWHSR
jgi:hypothetical protein